MNLTGQTLKHYRVLEEISRGGMGVVYRATDMRLNRDVALKVLPDDLTHDPDRRRRFLHEAQAASSLEHPHIAVIYEADEADGTAYIAMELIRGEKLSDLLARQRPTPARSLEMATEIAAGLARAHEKGIVHRDLKPANVMLTDEGHAKIIDFGIAKLIESAAVAGAPTQTGHETGLGVVLGTTTYMSPEQARADHLDHRSDIFSFGIVLHEMLAGQPPFRGKTGIETASAILHEPAPRLPSLGPAVTSDASTDIQRIVDKCLAKEPDDRYQGMKDAAVDLRAARRRLDTGPQPAISRQSRGVPIWGWMAPAILIAGIATAFIVTRDRDTAPAATTTRSARPSVAVLYFDNTTGDKSLDWMRTGITEMVVTDLSQSGDIEVVGTDRLYGILAELKRQDDPVVSPEAISAVAERTGVDRVIVGSYIRSGEALRINVRLQDAKTGRIESSERVDGANASALFAMVDDLSKRIRAKFDGLRASVALLQAPGVTGRPGLDRGLGDVTTSSIDAYRLYAEGNALHERFREREATEMFENAVAIDPSFAMAYVKLAVTEGNQGHLDRRDKYAAQALKLADRLTLRERYYIEGYYYGNRPATIGRAIDAYNKCLELDPGHHACRHNVAVLYMDVDRVAEGIAHYEYLIRRGSTVVTAFGNLASGYRTVGEPEKARALIEAFLKRNPESSAGHLMLAMAFVGLGRNEDAIRELNQRRLQGANDALTGLTLGTAQLLREDWNAADQTAKGMLSSGDETMRFFGAGIQYFRSLFLGRGAESLRWADRGAASYKMPGSRSANAHGFAAMSHLARGESALATEAATRSVIDGKGSADEARTLVIQAWAMSAAGQLKEADAAIAALAANTDPASTRRDQRNLLLARGLAARARGDAAGALPILEAAFGATPPRVGVINALSQHLLLWSSLGGTLLDLGRPAEALPWFIKVAESGFERSREPVEFVRSFYFLGRIYELQGDMTKARDAYRRFVGYWKDGDLDRDRIAEAQRKIAG